MAYSMFSSGIPDIEERTFFSSLFSVIEKRKPRTEELSTARFTNIAESIQRLPEIVISRNPPMVIVDGLHCLTNKHLSLASVYGCDVSSNS